MEISGDDVRNILTAMGERCSTARLVGGISHLAVVAAGRGAPDGYWFDDLTAYWIPVGISLDVAGHA